jgi:hypothetical protein
LNEPVRPLPGYFTKVLRAEPPSLRLYWCPTVPSSCPICEQPIAQTAAHCSVCGFPTALAIEGLRSIDQAGSDEPPAGNQPNGTAAGTTPTAPPPTSPEADLNATISRSLREKMEVLRDLGRGAPDVTSELCEAALSEAEGRVAQALDILRSAQLRLEHQTDEVLARRLQSLEERRLALQKAGVRFAIGAELDHLREAVEGGEREEASVRLVESERRLGQFESDWKGLQGLLSQIEGLRSEAAELGIPLGEISGELEAIREKLAAPDLTEDILDTLAQEAAQTLMLLHEAIPTSLEEELIVHEKKLEQYPEEHAPSAAARRLHVEATRHLKKGRLSEAVSSVRELRRQLEELEKETAASAGRAPPSPSAPAETEQETLERLLRKARSLAARVRTLPPESDSSREAAIQIREATEHLRARELAEADLTLSRLMRTLAYEEPR